MAELGDTTVYGRLYAQDKTDMVNSVYPVGSIYSSTESTNPHEIFGVGTWDAFAEGRVIVGVGTSDRTFSAGETGGESTVTLDVGHLPSHRHMVTQPKYTSGGSWGSDSTVNSQTENYTYYEGGDSAHNNMMKYVVVYHWRRSE